jgi:hypothetical protein
MLIAGSVDGAYRVTDLGGDDATVERVLDPGDRELLAGSIPVPDDVVVSYTPLSQIAH